MTPQHVIQAELLAGPSLRLHFEDGFVGIARLDPLIRCGGVFAAIAAQPERFAIVQNGRALAWVDADGEEIDLCADALRQMAEVTAAQAAA